MLPRRLQGGVQLRLLAAAGRCSYSLAQGAAAPTSLRARSRIVLMGRQAGEPFQHFRDTSLVS